MISPNPYSVKNVRRRKSLPALLLLMFVVLVVAGALFVRSTIAALVMPLLQPLVHAREALTGGEVATLRAELASTTLALQDRNSLYVENQTLKKLLGRSHATREVLAGVLLRPPLVPYDTLTIDAGSDSGIKAGALVYGGGTLAIGEVSEVYSSYARVLLFSAPGRNYDATVALKDGSVLPLPLTGQGGGSLVGQVPAGSKVSVGDSIVVPGVDGAFVGSVSHIEQADGASFMSVYSTLPVNIYALRFVEVVVE